MDSRWPPAEKPTVGRFVSIGYGKVLLAVALCLILVLWLYPQGPEESPAAPSGILPSLERAVTFETEAGSYRMRFILYSILAAY